MIWKWEYTVILIMGLYIAITGFGFAFGFISEIVREAWSERSLFKKFRLKINL